MKTFNKKYGDRVLPNIGLCVCTLKIVDIGDYKIYPGDGAPHVEVHVKMLVFRPQVGEIIQAKVTEANEKGITASVGFFHDIFIQKDDLKSFMEYGLITGVTKEFIEEYHINEDEKYWWSYLTKYPGDEEEEEVEEEEEIEEEEEEEDEENKEPFMIKVDEIIRFKVHSVKFTTTQKMSNVHGAALLATTTETSKKNAANAAAPKAPMVKMESTDAEKVPLPPPPKMRRSRSMSFEVTSEEGPPPPMCVIGTVAVAGLGCINWW